MKASFIWLFFLLLTFIVTLPVSWWGMSKVDFFYSSLHDGIGIDEHIERYAPYNRFKKTEFEKSTKSERVTLFHGVVESIHNHGKGLKSLSYKKKSNNQEVLLFTNAEVTHLKDVANLLEKIKPIVILAVSVWFLLVLWIFYKRKKLPTAKRFSLLGFCIVVLAGLVLSIGPEKVFNQLHIWAFPDNHQWFFYYEDSLMSTMMKAPHLFAYISAIWVSISIILTVFLLYLLHLAQPSRR